MQFWYLMMIQNDDLIQTFLNFNETIRRPVTGKLLLIYLCNFHVLSNFLLIYICKLHWNSMMSKFSCHLPKTSGYLLFLVVLIFLVRSCEVSSSSLPAAIIVSVANPSSLPLLSPAAGTTSNRSNVKWHRPIISTISAAARISRRVVYEYPHSSNENPPTELIRMPSFLRFSRRCQPRPKLLGMVSMI